MYALFPPASATLPERARSVSDGSSAAAGASAVCWPSPAAADPVAVAAPAAADALPEAPLSARSRGRGRPGAKPARGQGDCPGDGGAGDGAMPRFVSRYPGDTCTRFYVRVAVFTCGLEEPICRSQSCRCPTMHTDTAAIFDVADKPYDTATWFRTGTAQQTLMRATRRPRRRRRRRLVHLRPGCAR